MRTEKSAQLFTQTTTEDIALRLRTLRKSRGWSLAQVEKISHGAIKAVVLGSYERSDRSLSVSRAIEIADLYAVPLSHLLCSSAEAGNRISPQNRIVIDLRRASRMSSVTTEGSEKVRTFRTFIAWIASQRSDWNGEVLSLRRSDTSVLALLTFTNEVSLMDWLAREKLLLTTPARP
jgi:transcriptional regulator with XRE-family HTH domain